MAGTANEYLGGALGTITSPVATTSVISERLDPQIDTMIREIGPDRKLFTFLLDSTPQGPKLDQKIFTWYEQGRPEYRLKVVSCTSAGLGTTCVVADAGYVVPGHVLLCRRTGEYLWVSAKSSTSLTIRRSVGSTQTRALSAGDTLLVVSSALQEGQNAPDMYMRSLQTDSLRSQFSGHSFGWTLHTKYIAYRGVDETERIRKQGIQEFNDKRESKLLFSAPDCFTPASGNEVSMGAGLHWFCTRRNTFTLLDMSYDGLAAAAMSLRTTASGDDFWFLTGQDMTLRLIRMLRDIGTVQTRSADTEVGFDISRVTAPHFAARIVRHPLLDELGGENEILVFRMADFRKRTLIPIFSKLNTQANDAYSECQAIAVDEALDCTNTYGAGLIVVR